MINFTKMIEQIKNEFFPILSDSITFYEDDIENIIYYKHEEGEYKIMHCVGPIAKERTIVQENKLYKELNKEKTSLEKRLN